MTRYVVLLRAVNVGGRTVIKLDDLHRCLEKVDLEDVLGYRQSGTIIFSSAITDEMEMGRVIRDQLEQLTGNKVEI